jgi:hypothetical protein
MADQHKSVGVPVRERPQQHCIHHAENCSVRADPQRQREHGHEGEAGISPQHRQAKPKILKECIDESDSTHLAIHLLAVSKRPLFVIESSFASFVAESL